MRSRPTPVMPADPPEARGSLLRGGPVRVATIPFADPYVDAVLPPDVIRVGPSGELSPWLDVSYLAEHADEVDVLHLHTGPAHVTVVAAQCWAETARRLGIPLVVTVHRMRAPGHGCSREPAMDAHLSAVLATAEVVFTLTPGAADEIADRFGRTAIVVAHPSVAVPDPELGAERGLVGLRLRAVPLPDQEAMVRGTLSGAVSGGGRLRVLAEAGADVARAVRERAAQGEFELVVHRAEERAMQFQQLHVA